MTSLPSYARLKDVAEYINRGIAPSYSDEHTGLLAFSQKCTRIDRTVDPTLGRPMLDPGAAGQSSILRPSDLVVNSTGTGTLGRVGLIEEQHTANETLVADGHVTIVRVNPRLVDARFLWLQLSTEAFYEFANATLAVGSTNQTELGRAALGAVRIYLPPLVEQQRIVHGLDAMMERVDRLIAEQEHQIRLLREHRQVAIDAAVSGRPRPQVPADA